MLIDNGIELPISVAELPFDVSIIEGRRNFGARRGTFNTDATKIYFDADAVAKAYITVSAIPAQSEKLPKGFKSWKAQYKADNPNATDQEIMEQTEILDSDIIANHPSVEVMMPAQVDVSQRVGINLKALETYREYLGANSNGGDAVITTRHELIHVVLDRFYAFIVDKNAKEKPVKQRPGWEETTEKAADKYEADKSITPQRLLDEYKPEPNEDE